LDIDSDNTLNLQTPERTAHEDEIENAFSGDDRPGKVILVQARDNEPDGVPGYFDGFSLVDPTLAPEYESASGPGFVPLVLELHGSLSNLKLRFVVSDSSPPNAITTIESGEYEGEFELAPGKIRIWNKDFTELRTADDVKNGGNYISDSVLYEVEELGFSDQIRQKTFFVEAVRISNSVADIQIKVQYSFAATPTANDWEEGDAVRLTAVGIDVLARTYDGVEWSVWPILNTSDVSLRPEDVEITLEPGFHLEDIGTNTELDVSENQSNGFLFIAGGNGFGGSSDSLNYMAYELDNDCDITIKVDSLAGATDPILGIMLRNDLTSDSAFAIIGVKGDGTVFEGYRNSSGANAHINTIPNSAGLAKWLRLTRVGNTISLYYKDNEQDPWTNVTLSGSPTFDTSIWVGIAVSSGDEAQSVTINSSDFTSERISENISIPYLPGAFMYHKIRVSDPRSSGLSTVTLGGHTLDLYYQGGYWETDEFIIIEPGDSQDLTGLPSIVIQDSASEYVIGYNPEGTHKKLAGKQKLSKQDIAIGTIVNDVGDTLKSEGWTPDNPDDLGAFGKRVDADTAAKLKGKKGWLVSFYVFEEENGQWTYHGTKNPGLAGQTQVDAAFFKDDYKPKEGKPVNRSKLLDTYDVKTSLSGGLGSPSDPDSQFSRLKRFNNNKDAKVVKPRWRFMTKTGGYRLRTLGKIAGAAFAIFGTANTLHAVVYPASYDEDLREIGDLAAKYKKEKIDNDPTAFVTKLEINDKMRSYVGNFTFGTADWLLDIIRLWADRKVINDLDIPYDPAKDDFDD